MLPVTVARLSGRVAVLRHGSVVVLVRVAVVEASGLPAQLHLLGFDRAAASRRRQPADSIGNG